MVEAKEPPAPPVDASTVGLTYDLGPDGATFDPAITLTFTYDPDEIPEGVNEEDLVIAIWDEDAGEWVELEDCTVDTVNNIISAPVSHFSRYTVIAPIPPPPPLPPPPPPLPGPPTVLPPPPEPPLLHPSMANIKANAATATMAKKVVRFMLSPSCKVRYRRDWKVCSF